MNKVRNMLLVLEIYNILSNILKYIIEYRWVYCVVLFKITRHD